MNSKSSADAELAELARGAAWGLMKGGHLDMWGRREEGPESAPRYTGSRRAGWNPHRPHREGIGRIYTRAEVEEEQ